MMYSKAICFGDSTIAKEILANDDVAIIKGLERKVSNFNENHWVGVRQIIIYEGLLAKEIDVIIEGDGVVNPIEIKKTATPDKRILRTFGVIDKTPLCVGTSAVLCMSDKLSAFDRNNLIVPIWMI